MSHKSSHDLFWLFLLAESCGSTSEWGPTGSTTDRLY